ncbi:MAG TPA: hypothetical protein VFV38_21965 [Ktedonobacteraceae bacterium]|nr:hypothetical protein [Ktedonobacteraceae bacterium]
MNNPMIETFVHTYLLPLQRQKKQSEIEIKNPGVRADVLVNAFLGGKPGELPAITVADPTIRLNRLLYEVMRTGNADLPIPSEIAAGFSNCGRGFYGAFKNSWQRGMLLSADVEYPPHLVVPTRDGETRWSRLPETETEQLLHFIYHLRELMRYLAEHPIRKKATTSTAEVAQMLTMLPRRAVFVRSGDDMGVIYTDDVLPSVSNAELATRMQFIQAQTRARYCRPKAETSKSNKPIRHHLSLTSPSLARR